MAGTDAANVNAFTSEQLNDTVYRLRDIIRNGTQRKRILVTMFSQPRLESSASDRDSKHLTFCRQKDCYLDADVDMLYHILKAQFNLRDRDINVHIRRTVTQVHEIMHDVGDKTSNADYDIFIFGFFTYLSVRQSHENSDEYKEWLQFYDGQETLDAILDDIKDSSAMALKPKIFLVQADDLRMKYPTHAYKSSEWRVVNINVPTEADRLVLFSTVPQFFSRLKARPGAVAQSTTNSCPEVWRARAPFMPQTSGGVDEPACSLMVEAFVDVITNPAFSREHLLARTYILNARFEQLTRQLNRTYEYVQLHLPRPLILSTLTKKLYI